MKKELLKASAALALCGCTAQVDAPVDADISNNSNITVNNYGDINASANANTTVNGNFQVDADGVVIIPTLDDLERCSSKLEGTAVYIKDVKKSAICRNGAWKEVDSGSSSRPSYDDDDVPGGSNSGSNTSNPSATNPSTSNPSVVHPTITDPVDPGMSGSVMVPSGVGCYKPNIFCGDNDYYVRTGKDAGTETSGYWFAYSDNDDGGKSKIVWPVPLGNEYASDAVDPVVDYLGAYGGTAVLGKGTLDYNPFVGVGFNIGGETFGGSIAVVDVSSWGGICIAYSSEAPAVLEMGLGNYDVLLGYDNPFVSLAKTTGSSKCFAWSQFKQAGWGSGVISGTEAAGMLVSLKFKIQGADGTSAAFQIKSLATYAQQNGSSSTVTTPTVTTPTVTPTNPSVVPTIPSLSSKRMSWTGSSGEYRVDTGVDAGYETSGYWFHYDDSPDGGKSSITWPVPLGNEYSDDAKDPVIDYCGGLCGTFNLSRGTLDYNPFIGVGFMIAGDDGSGYPVAADVSGWGGVCVAYTSDASISLELGLGDKIDASLGYDVPFVTLPKSVSGSSKCFTWSQFKQAGWGTGKIYAADAATQLVYLKFKIQGASGTTGNFNITAVSSYQ